MASHVKILGILHIVLSSLVILAGILMLVLFGGIAGLVGTADQTADARVAVPVLGALGGILFLLLLLIGIPGVIAGIGLIQFRPWGRILGIIISAIELLNVPLGTALGIYGLWVLLSQGAEQLFLNPPRQPMRT